VRRPADPSGGGSRIRKAGREFMSFLVRASRRASRTHRARDATDMFDRLTHAGIRDGDAPIRGWPATGAPNGPKTLERLMQEGLRSRRLPLNEEMRPSLRLWWRDQCAFAQFRSLSARCS